METEGSHHARKGPLFVPVLSQMNPVHASNPIPWRFILILSYRFCLCLKSVRSDTNISSNNASGDDGRSSSSSKSYCHALGDYNLIIIIIISAETQSSDLWLW